MYRLTGMPAPGRNGKRDKTEDDRRRSAETPSAEAARVREVRVVASVTRRLEFKRSLRSLLFSIPRKMCFLHPPLSPPLSLSLALSLSLLPSVCNLVNASMFFAAPRKPNPLPRPREASRSLADVYPIAVSWPVRFSRFFFFFFF